MADLEDHVEAHVDHGTLSGYFVRLDVYTFEGQSTMVCLSSEDARELAGALVRHATAAEEHNAEGGR
jgi:hypothetical protein